MPKQRLHSQVEHIPSERKHTKAVHLEVASLGPQDAWVLQASYRYAMVKRGIFHVSHVLKVADSRKERSLCIKDRSGNWHVHIVLVWDGLWSAEVGPSGTLCMRTLPHAAGTPAPVDIFNSLLEPCPRQDYHTLEESGAFTWSCSFLSMKNMNSSQLRNMGQMGAGMEH